MPRRAQHGHRGRLEAALTPTLLAALEELRELLNIHDWQDSVLCAPFQQSAVVLSAANMVAGGVCSAKDALEHAAIALGVSADTTRSRAKRWPRDSRSLCTPTAREHAGSLNGEPSPEIAA